MRLPPAELPPIKVSDKADIHPSAVDMISRFSFEDGYEIDDILEARDLHRRLDAMLATLTPREERVLRLRYFEDMTLDEVGDEVGVCRERIRQIEAKALRKFRHPSRSKKLGVVKPAAPKPPVGFVWLPPYEGQLVRHQNVFEPFGHYSEIMAETTIAVCFGNGVWRSVRPEKIITGEPVCDRWETEAVVAFWSDGQPCGERWEDVRRSVKRPFTERVLVPGRWVRQSSVN